MAFRRDARRARPGALTQGTRGPRWCGAALLWLAGAASASQAHETGEWLLFPQLDYATRSGMAADSPLERDEFNPALNVFVSKDIGVIRVLGELLLTEHETELERLQLGWLLGPDRILWLGRYHTPLGIWNSLHHHGAYMQTSISRPHIIEYEDDGGILPTHYSGLLFEGVQPRGGGALFYAAGVGVGPELEERLEALDITAPDAQQEHKLGAVLRLSYRPERYETDEYGAFAARTEVPVVDRPADEVLQYVIGAFLLHDLGPAQLSGTLFFLRHRVDLPGGTRRSGFQSGHLQLDYPIEPDLTVFGRLERSNASDDDPYLRLLPDMPLDRIAAGLRYELTAHQALKLEAGICENRAGHFNQLQLQWSALFP